MIARLSDRIRAARRLKGWSQADLAQRLHVSTSAVGHWECKKASVPLTARLVDLAALLEVNFEWLATDQGAMKPDTAAISIGSQSALSKIELRLIGCFRRLTSQAQTGLLDLIENQRPSDPSISQSVIRSTPTTLMRVETQTHRLRSLPSFQNL